MGGVTSEVQRPPGAVIRRLGPAGEAALVALALAAFYLVLRTSPSLAAGAFNDDGVYLALGKALADGEGYRSVYAVGEPVHAKYPPALPVVYAGLWALLGSLGAVHEGALLLSLVTTAAAAGVLWWLARARIGLGIPTALLFVLGPFLLEGSVQYFNLAISEPFFLLLWASSLVLFHRLAGSGPPGAPTDAGAPGARTTSERPRAPTRAGLSAGVLAVLIGLTAAAAALFRSQAIVLLPALALGMLLARASLRSLAYFAGASLLPVLAWRIWHRRALLGGPVGTQPDEGAYVSWTPSGAPTEMLHFVGEVIGSQLRMYGTYMPPHLSGWWALGLVLWIVFLVLAAWGTARLWRRCPDVVLTAWGSAALVFLWPWWQDRFVLALLPFLGLPAGAAVQGWMDGRGRRSTRAAYWTMAAVAALVALRQLEIRQMAFPTAPRDARFFHPSQFLPQNTLYLLATSRWLEANAAPGADVLAPHPVGIWLYTGRKVVNATPALPDVGPSVWDVPGRFLARRVAEDEPELIALWMTNYFITRDVSVVQAACPGALEYLGFTREYTRVAFYRVHREDRCLRERFLDPARMELAREEAERG